IHGDYGIPIAVVECKAPTVAISQATFEQAARYNLVFKVRYLFITNGLKSYCCVVDHEQGKVRFLDHLPNFRTLNDK
ncbi:MAG TPA: type I restriction enzyme HsdR N-terminal domain-containing protein, partial [Flavobacteriales bacterium]|nr:type I restriction enzyme HsdR N-terminal domain-containing protein [Flavobacteriales bacterium]